MKRYLMTSKKLLDSRLVFSYDSKTLQFKSFEIDGTLSEKQWVWLRNQFPYTIKQLLILKELGKQHKTLEVKELKDLSFKVFWNAYGFKRHKSEAEEQWSKLSDQDKSDAIDYASRYKQRCKLDSVPMVYAKRYLRRKLWQDEE